MSNEYEEDPNEESILGNVLVLNVPDDVTRFGKSHKPTAVLGTEERFQWQKSGQTSDVMYDIPSPTPAHAITFGSSLRKGMDEENPDAKKRSTGPGSYDIAGSYDHNSEYAKHEAGRFGQAPRQSMAMKTPSAGAVYNIDKQFWNGPEKSHGVGFANAARGELHGSAEGVNADMYAGRSETGPAITIAKKLTTKEQGSDTPGAIYDVHEKVNFQTGPAYSFGHGKESKTMEMPALVSSPTRQHSAPDNVTRFGKIKEADLKFGSEQRFRWQTTGETSDVAYDVQDAAPVKSVIFGSSLRKGMDEENPDAKKRSTGPGSYDIAGSYDHNSEYAKHEAGRFGQAPRQSMAMKTASAGAVYNIDKQFWNGPEKSHGVGFANAARGELHGSAEGVNADMYAGKSETGPAITIAKKLTTKELGSDTPGAIYDVHEKVNFQTGPAYSFGHGKESKAMEMPALVSSPTRQHSAPDNVTRFGKIKEADLKFGSEQRFRWQTTGETSDVAYDVQDPAPVKSVIFGSSLRKGMDEENPDAKKRSTGPGSYDIAGSYDHNSEYAKHEAGRFGQAPRQSMAMKTPSAGAVYNIDKQFWNGPERTNGVGFANATRGELYGTALSVNADMFLPKQETGPAITIAKKLTTKELGADTPGPIYQVHEKVDFRTGPSYSFGHGKVSKSQEFLPEVSHSPARSPSKSSQILATRYGKVKEADLSFGTEQRFKWQNAGETSDVAYDVQDLNISRSMSFGNSLRKGMDEENPDAKKRSTGPGSYDFAPCYDHISEYNKHAAGRFGQAPRQSMAMKTPSAGAVYNIEKQFWNGPDKSHGVGFANATRGELYGTSLSANADMYCAKAETGPAITIGKKFKDKGMSMRSPGAVYDVHKKVDFRTGPAFSFGKGKKKRFKKVNYLPEIIND